MRRDHIRKSRHAILIDRRTNSPTGTKNEGVIIGLLEKVTIEEG